MKKAILFLLIACTFLTFASCKKKVTVQNGSATIGKINPVSSENITLSEANGDYDLKSDEITDIFFNDDSKAPEESALANAYIGKNIRVTGEYISVIDDPVGLDEKSAVEGCARYIMLKTEENKPSVCCYLKNNLDSDSIAIGETVTVEGKCLGVYISCVTLQDCTIIKE